MRFRIRAPRVALLLAGALVAAGLVSLPATPAYAATQCAVDYVVRSQWDAGFTADVTIRNLGDPINGWTLTFTYTGNQRVTQGWNGNWSQSGTKVTATNASWNGSIPTGGSTMSGFNASYSGSNPAPTDFAVNGVSCKGANLPPTVTLTSPTAGQTFLPGATITLAASASDTDGTVSRVEFWASPAGGSNGLIGYDTSAPFSIPWPNVAAGDYALTAIATDSGGATTTSAPVAISVSAPKIVANPTTMAVQQGSSGSYNLTLSAAPTATVTVTTTRSGTDTDLTITAGASLTFTTTNWNVAQKVTITAGTNAAQVGGSATFTSTATGYGAAAVTVTETGRTSAYSQWFLDLYAKIKNPANGYFSPKGIPYHSVETLIVEAPDYGHETTSETYSYWLWLEANYGRVTSDWTGFNAAWSNMETYMIPTAADQPGQGAYNVNDPAMYGPEMPYPDQYPVALNDNVKPGVDPLYSELNSTYGTPTAYDVPWIMDTDNRYGFGGKCEDKTGTPAWINTFQRGPQESVWETVPQPDCEKFVFGNSSSGFLSLFNNGGGGFAQQVKYTDAPDANARLVQAAYWALTYAKAQGKTSAIAATIAKAAKLGDYTRYSMYDKYFKQIGNCLGSVACPAGTGKANEAHYLLSWYFSWGGAVDGSWAYRVSGSGIHSGYQNPLAAYALSTVSELKPLSPSAATDWASSLTRQLEFYRWLQSSEGGIAGGATNSWGGNYGDVTKPPTGDPTFYGMYYDWQPVYQDPPSNQWFGMQAWTMERLAEYYYVTGNTTAKALLDKWVPWAMSVSQANRTTGALTIPDKLTWSGTPDTWNPGSPGGNAGLHVSASGTAVDLGISASLSKALAYYAAKSGSTTARDFSQAIIDLIHKNYADPLGFSATETRTDYNRFTQAYSSSTHSGLYLPSGWTGTYPNGSGGTINMSASTTNTFLSIRPWYTSDPQWPKVQSYLNGGAAPTFNYHRFWGEADIATAFDTFAQLFPTINPPAGF